MALRIGIVGAGRSGYHQAQILRAHSDVAICAVAETNRPSRDSFADAFGIALSVNDHHRLATDAGIDAIFICTPPSSHSAIAVNALQHGKHVICQPPLCVNIEQADEILTAVEESGKQLFVALPQRYDPFNRMALSLIDAEEIGYPFLILGSHIENEFDRLNDWHDWKGTWDPGGGGVLMERGSEIIDLLTYLFGKIESVSADCTRFAVDALNKAEDTCLMDLDFEEEISVQLALTGAARYNPWPEAHKGIYTRLEIYGTHGAMRLCDSEPRLVLAKEGSSPTPVSPTDCHVPTTSNMIQNFIDCILEDKEPLVTVHDAIDALKVVLAGYKSSQMKRRVDVMEHL